MNEIVFEKLPKYSYYILFITSSIIGVFLIFYNPLGFSNVRAKGSYIFPLLVFIWLWKNYFFLYKNHVRWNTEIILIKVNRTNRSEEHTSELQSRENLVCRLLLEKKYMK